jgi:UV excision repair protein RAD23
MPAEGMKLIHSGKILKDTDTVESCKIKPSDFLVVMISKPKKAAAPAPAPAAAAAAPETPAPSPPAAATSNSTTTSTTTPAETPAASAPAAAAAAAPPAPAHPADNFSAETVATLTALGFPEAEVRHCLRAANGNPDIAVEFLTNGIPPGIPAAGTAAASLSGNASGQPLAALRAHPQFDALRRLVQSNPQMLQQVLTQIGQQQPELLQEINANQALFLQMMNEPVSDTSTSGATSSPPAPTGAGAPPPGLMEGMANPQQMAAMLQNMNPQELQQMATMMGMSPEQLQQTARMIGQIPPDQLQNVMMQAMQASGGGMGGMGGTCC